MSDPSSDLALRSRHWPAERGETECATGFSPPRHPRLFLRLWVLSPRRRWRRPPRRSQPQRDRDAGNEGEPAIAVNPTNPSNVVAMSTLPDVVAGIAVGVSFNSGRTWARRVIGTTGDPLGEICCDQQLAWDRFGNLWMTYLINTSGDVFIALSRTRRTFTQVGDIVTDGDQPSIAVGPNSVWVSYTLPRNSGRGIGGAGHRVRPVRGLQHAREVPTSNGRGGYGDLRSGRTAR